MAHTWWRKPATRRGLQPRHRLRTPGSWLNWTNSKQEITMQHNNRNDERQKLGSGRQGKGTRTISGCVAPGFQELERAQL